MVELSSESAPVQLRVEADQVGMRLDAFLVAHLPAYSRSQICRAVQAGQVQVDGVVHRPACRLKLQQVVTFQLPGVPPAGPRPENIPLDILYEDEAMVAINKASGMVVHPAKGHWSGTLTAALAHHFDRLSQAGGPTRPGIVHRLDRETSGVIVIAKTDAAHMRLAEQFAARTVHKEYFAIVQGVPDRDRDEIDQPIGVHPYHRERMAIRAGHETSRQARTVYEVQERWQRCAMLKALPHTGRTHQIRVHLAHVGCPVLCDRLYSGRSQVTVGELTGSPAAEDLHLRRLALHAHRLRIRHPQSEHGEELEFVAPLPSELAQFVEALRHDTPPRGATRR